MLSRIVMAAVITIGSSSAAYANCNCGHQSAYSVSEHNGVTVMRGNIPKLENPQWAVTADRRAAEKRASSAERRARVAEREAQDARDALATRQSNLQPEYRRYDNRYFSGDYRYGASIASFGGRGRGGRAFGGNKSISRPVFSSGIRF